MTRMFARISARYDRLNSVMSAGRHHVWRRMAVEMALGEMTGPALDVATGTGDFALELAGHASVSSVVGLDSTPEMLSVADAKSRAMERSARVSWLVGDAHHIPCRDAQFICATVGFGIRNFASVPDALREIVRVVKPGGKVVVLEIVRMEGRSLLSRLFPIYFRYATPWIGGLLAGDREAYAYLPASVEGFLTASQTAGLMEEAGLRNVTFRKLALGSVAIHVGDRPYRDEASSYEAGRSASWTGVTDTSASLTCSTSITVPTS